MLLQKTASAARYGLHEVLAEHIFALLDKAIDERMGELEVERQVCPIFIDECKRSERGEGDWSRT